MVLKPIINAESHECGVQKSETSEITVRSHTHVGINNREIWRRIFRKYEYILLCSVELGEIIVGQLIVSEIFVDRYTSSASANKANTFCSA